MAFSTRRVWPASSTPDLFNGLTGDPCLPGFVLLNNVDPPLPRPLFTYSAFGLNIGSEIPIAGLARAVDVQNPSISVFSTDFPVKVYQQPDTEAVCRDDPADMGRQFWTACEGKYYCLAFTDGPDFAIDQSGAMIWAKQPANVSNREMGLYLISVIGFCLRLKGRLCLHASAVEIDGRAMAITGSSGSGKSTMAAVFAQMGMKVISDDILPLSFCLPMVRVHSGYTRLRLWPDATAHLFPDSSLPRLLPDWDKQYLDLSGDRVASTNDIPLGAIYVLADRVGVDGVGIHSPGGAEQVMSIVENTYRNDLLRPVHRVSELIDINKLVMHVPVRRISSPDTLEDLSRFGERLINDFIDLQTRQFNSTNKT